MGVAVYLFEFGPVGCGIGFFGVRRSAKHGDDIELRTMPQRIMDDVITRSAPQYDAIARDIDGEFDHRHDGAKRRITDRTRFAVADELLPEQRADAVSRNQRRA